MSLNKIAMKRLLLVAFIGAAFLTSCAKDVKAPVNTANASEAKSSTTSTTGSATNSGSQAGHTCGGGTGSTGH